VKRLLLLAVLGSGCGYVGEPLPPLLNIPSAVADLQAKQVGERIRIEFTIPPLTTEGQLFTDLERIELRVGPAGEEQFSVDAWAAEATALEGVQALENKVTFETPAKPWVGRSVIVGANLHARNGRFSGWSNLASLAVVAPVAPPSSVAASNVRQGVRLVWRGNAASYRILGRPPGGSVFAPLAEVSSSEWVDTATQYGKLYAYQIVALAKTPTGEAVSDASSAVQIVPEDRFPPEPPAGFSGVASTDTVELAWEPSPDAVTYTIYRAAEGSWERIGATTGVPAYSDKPPQPGVEYRYSVTASDAAGNESGKSQVTRVIAPPARRCHSQLDGKRSCAHVVLGLRHNPVTAGSDRRC
jgi:hypothetical protein